MFGEKKSRALRPTARAAAECRAFFASLSGCIDQSALAKTSPNVRRHIEQCAACEQFLRALRQTADRMTRPTAGKARPAVADHVRDVLHQH